MKIRAAVCSGLEEPWKTEEIEIDAPHAHEVVVQMAFAGMCHSDEHLRHGDISVEPEVLSMFGVDSMFPCIGGHEGAGVVVEVGRASRPWPSATTWPRRSCRRVARASGAPRDDSTSATWACSPWPAR